MKGIILAAGKGTRLYPASMHISKVLLPIYDKPMIYYPLATLMSAGIRDILVVVNKDDKAYFKKLLGDGKQFGISIKYAVQKTQKGIADALLVGEKFIDGDACALALGDNVYHGEGMYELLAQAMAESEGATIFCKEVADPRAFGVAEVDANGVVVSLEEKPKEPKSNWVATGLYFYDKNACEYAKRLKPSERGELEITDLNKIYMEKGLLKAQFMENDSMWADTGTFESLLDASNYIHNREKNGREIVGCPEAIAFESGFITKRQLLEWVSRFSENAYFDYLRALAAEE